MTRSARFVSVLLALVLIVGVGYLAAQPVRQMRDDIDAQRRLLQEQVATTKAQLELTQRQLDIALTTQELVRRGDVYAASTLTVVRQLLEVARTTEAQVGTTAQTTLRLRELASQLLALTREVERHAESIDRKTGPTAAR